MIKRLLAEAIGTAFLLIAVVGSGIMAETLTGDTALALLANAVATGAALVVLITTLGPISGAHFNPAVTLAMALRRRIEPAEAAAYILVQIGAGIVGVLLAHLMFETALLQVASTERTGPAQWSSEIIASFGLVFFIFLSVRYRPDAVSWVVGLYITGAYWFTASTSFANPAVTIARSLTDTFSGIAPVHAPAFILAQIIGAVLATGVAAYLAPDPKQDA
ncbi:MAG: aquaporin family protein [Alphaproteobacteria bacterium]|nr:aquaporin family protein [Alphaproteobacteria bacterium]